MYLRRSHLQVEMKASSNRFSPHLHGVIIVGLFAILVSGCRRHRDQTFVPTEETAQRTLETALLAWQNGKLPPTRVQESSPAVQLLDTHYQPGQKLASFKVLGPTTGDAERCYAVRLTMDNPREEIRARYVVLGLDPLWVMRYEDFEMVMHWDHAIHGKAEGQKKP
jgi:hypothetical protein